MNTKEIWGAKYIAALPATSFLYANESMKLFPYKDETGNVSVTNFLNSLAKISSSNLTEENKRKVTAKAARIAKESKVDLAESFLDEFNLTGPLFPPYLEKTLVEFNDGTITGFDQECCDYYGAKLVRALHRWSNNGASEDFYDDEGRRIGSFSQGDYEHEAEYEYQDGLVVRTKTRSSNNDESETEYSIRSTDEEELEFSTAEIAALAESGYGGAIKTMRSKKKMSRDQMSAKMRMTSSRLKEIEDGDDADDDELSEIAKGLGISSQKLKRTLDSLSSKEEENGSGIIKIVRRVIEIVKPTIFTQEEIVDFEVKEGKWDEAFRINGFISEETIKKNPDGTINFSVPLFKYGELTGNNNRYTEEFADNLMKHFKRLDKKTSKISYEDIPGLTANDIAVAEMLEGHSLDMMATHRARQGKGNPILERAGRILGGREGKVEGDKTFILLSKTIGGPAGESVAAQILEGMIRGVSLYAWPVKFEENTEGGHDVYDGMLVGADFTNEGGNLIQFKDKSNAAPVLN